MLPNHEYVFETYINCFSYDPETGDIFYKKRKDGKTIKVGTRKNDILYVYLICKQVRYNVRSHRLAWRLYYGEWPKGRVRHKNGVNTDNRIENLIYERGTQRCLKK